MSASKIKGAAFDLEGTVVDLERFHFHEGFVPATKELGMDIDFETICTIPYAIGGGDQVIADGISKMSGGKIDPTRLREVKMRYYDEAIETQDMSPRPGFVDVLKRIKEAGLPVAIGSLTPTDQARTILDRSGVGKLFPEGNIVLLEDVKEKKPKPDVYIETSRRMKIDPSSQLVFEDSSTGVEAALAAGSFVVTFPIFTFEDNLAKLVKAGASRIFADWREMSVDAVLENLHGPK